MQYKGLFRALDEEPGRELKVYYKYPQLQFKKFKRDYCKVNDTLIVHIVRFLRGDLKRRVSHNANAFLK